MTAFTRVGSSLSRLHDQGLVLAVVAPNLPRFFRAAAGDEVHSTVRRNVGEYQNPFVVGETVYLGSRVDPDKAESQAE
jgi:hypothetical protein